MQATLSLNAILRTGLCLALFICDVRAAGNPGPVLEACAETLNRSATIPAGLRTTADLPLPRVSFLGDAAVVLEYPSVFDVHSAPDPAKPLRSQPGAFLERSILEHLGAYVDASAYDFVLMYSLQELPGWIHAGRQWNGAPARNIGQPNSSYGEGARVEGWSRLRGTPHMNAIRLFEDWELFPGSDAGTLVPIHEIGHYWMTYWSRSSPGPRDWRPGDPVAYLAGAAYHWSWNWTDTIPGPEAMPGIMYSAPLSYSFNEFDLYAMGLVAFPELGGIGHAIYECAPPDYDACIPGDEHLLTAQHLLESLQLEGPDYFEGDGERVPAADPTAGRISALLVVVKSENEDLGDTETDLIRTISTALPQAWFRATWGRSSMSTAVRRSPPDPHFTINAGLNDAWYDPATDGQGFFVVVFPELNKLFISWFTYDVERPPQDVTAILGEPGHRWLTAIGDISGNMAVMDVDIASGGVFDSGQPAPVHQPDGTITIQFSDCTHGEVTYDITSVGLSGVIPVQRIVNDNVALCEALSEQ